MVARELMYAQPARPTLGGVWHAWSLDPVLLVIVIGAAVAYLAGVRRAGRDGTRWPVARTVAFLGPGLLGLVWVTMAWPAVYGRVLFSVRSVQLIALLMVVPFLLALGRPIQLAQTTLPPRAAARFDAILHSRHTRLLTVPVVSPLLLALVPIVIYFTPLYALTLTSPVAASVCRVALLLIGLAVLLPLWEAGSINVHVPYALALFFSLIELLADAVPGIVLRLDTHVIAASYYSGLGLAWGSSALGDQHLGGDLLWCIGEAIDVPVLALLVIQWVRADARDAQRVDLALDRAQANGPAGHAPDAGPGGADDGRVDDDGLGRPWWESDASVFGDRAGTFQRRRR
jgi:putative copper resistance protein D